MEDAEFYVDDELEPRPALREITNRFIGGCIEVHSRIGPGYPESVYQKSLAIELRHRGIRFQEQVPVIVTYRDEVVGEGRIDFLIEGCVIAELKAIEALAAIHTSQVVAYLRATHLKLAILVNFNVVKLVDGVKRVSL